MQTRLAKLSDFRPFDPRHGTLGAMPRLNNNQSNISAVTTALQGTSRPALMCHWRRVLLAYRAT